MRALVLASVAACYRGGSPAPEGVTPKPKPVVRASGDALAFLPSDSELVVALDVRALRQSLSWKKIEKSFFDKVATSMAPLRAVCNVDPVASLRKLTFATRDLGRSERMVVAVLRGIDRTATMACVEKMPHDAGTTVERGVVTFPSQHVAFGFADASTLVIVRADDAGTARLESIFTAGAPLRNAPAFSSILGEVRTREPLWFAANTEGPTFSSLQSLGVQPRRLFGWLNLHDGATGEIRIRLDASDLADKFSAQMQSQLSSLTSMFTELLLDAEGTDVVLRLRMTEQRNPSSNGVRLRLVGALILARQSGSASAH